MNKPQKKNSLFFLIEGPRHSRRNPVTLTVKKKISQRNERDREIS